MKWFSNLKIGSRIILIFSVQFVLWIAVCSVSAFFMSSMKTVVDETAPQSVSVASHTFSSFAMVVLVISLIFVLSAVFLTHLLTKSILEPIKVLSETCAAAANGIIDSAVSSNAQDEIGRLSRDLDAAFDAVRRFIGDLDNMCALHHVEGDVYAKIDSDKHAGAYKNSSAQLNTMIKQYISDARDVLYCFNEFANGNFNTQLRTFPGARAVANNIHAELRKSLSSLSKDILNTVATVANGNFEIRVADTEYQGEWAAVASEVNRLLDNIAEPIRETTDAMLEIFEGNLSPEIKGTFPGDFALVKMSSANAVESISKKIKEISGVLSELSNGNTSVQLQDEFGGDYAEIKVSVEKLLRRLTGMLFQMRETAAAAKANSEKLSNTLKAMPSVIDSLKTAAEEEKPVETESPFIDKFKRLSEVINENRYFEQLFSSGGEDCGEYDENSINTAEIGKSLLSTIKDFGTRIDRINSLAVSVSDEFNKLASARIIVGAPHSDTDNALGDASSDISDSIQDEDGLSLDVSFDDPFNISFDGLPDVSPEISFGDSLDDPFGDPFSDSFDEAFNEAINNGLSEEKTDGSPDIPDDLFDDPFDLAFNETVMYEHSSSEDDVLIADDLFAVDPEAETSEAASEAGADDSDTSDDSDASDDAFEKAEDTEESGGADTGAEAYEFVLPESFTLFIDELEELTGKDTEIIEKAQTLVETIETAEASLKARNNDVGDAVKKLLNEMSEEIDSLISFAETIGAESGAEEENKAVANAANELLEILNSLTGIPSELLAQSGKLTKACGGE